MMQLSSTASKNGQGTGHEDSSKAMFGYTAGTHDDLSSDLQARPQYSGVAASNDAGATSITPRTAS